ncbi:MAG TPA: DNA mismatch repair protein MutS [Clostridiaceae bacterium]|nr:DNA mismatch repair protein MutS [Clostridiaceae bacterium]
MANVTPMMQQYLEIKEKYKSCILFFRIGDFYEMFFEDAVNASRELGLVLTGKDCGMDERAPMCGIPFHAADSYVKKLVENGHKVAICEQMEDPAKAKGIVKRDIIKIITPGTITDTNMLDENKNNYIICVYVNKENYGISYCDISTGEFHVTQINYAGEQKLADEIARLNPSEIIYNSEFSKRQRYIKYINERFNISLNPYDDEAFEYKKCSEKVYSQFKNFDRKTNLKFGICACGALLSYIEETQKTDLSHINIMEVYSVGDFMMLDLSTRRNLELTETIRNNSKKYSLLWVLDKTYTAMGARMLRRWVEEPLISSKDIVRRQTAVEELLNNVYMREVLKEKLKGIYDIERLIGKIVYGNLNARDLISLKQSISLLPGLKKCISECKSPMLKDVFNKMDVLDDIYSLIDKAIADDPPVSIKDGFIIKGGYNETVDKLRTASVEGKNWIVKLEEKERESTNIKSLKVGYNKVFGYYIEVTKANLNLVPQDRYIRKQTLANSERYVTPELKEMESTILGAEDKVVQIEYDLFCDIREKIRSQIERMQNTSWAVSTVDVLCSLSNAASENDYVKPEITQDGTITIKDGRHPVIEKTLSYGMFVPNDTILDNDQNRIAIITGPNMAGKSTYMRQVALIVIMAQIGSFVPASYAKIGIVDKIFTRIGASDDLSSGQSTFMVEMSEVANILNNSTRDSLILLDEVGRGTSTYDGLSIAWSVIEYISDKSKIGAKTLFATHYHELTELEGRVSGIKNYCISVKEHGDDIIFLRKIMRGGADRSYGIQVAKLAGLPDEVIKRARSIADKLEENDINKRNENNNKIKEEVAADSDKENYMQLDFFGVRNSGIIDKLRKIDILKITPIDVINMLDKLIKEAKFKD